MTTSGTPAPSREIAATTPGGFVAALFTGLTELTARDDLSRTDRAAETGRLLERSLDLGTLARYSAGAGWAEASGPERARYLRLFREWALGVAAGRLADLSAGDMGAATLVVDTVEDAGGDRLVRSRVPLQGGVPLRLDWRLRAGDDGWRIVDVMIQGISFALVHRRMIGGIVARGGGLPAISEALARALDNGGYRPDDLLATGE